MSDYNSKKKMENIVKKVKVDLSKIKPIEGYLPNNFSDAVACLTRPYYEISEKEYEQIKKISNGYDFVSFRGMKVTFGTADNGFALMPVDIN